MIRILTHNQRVSATGHVRGFTLVELMLVVSIIGILAGVSITATRQVYHTARVARTEATILKIDRVIMDMYANYENRRVPSPNFGSSAPGSQVTQAARLWFLRDMIRMEMPCNWDEVLAGPVNFSFKYEYEDEITRKKQTGTTDFMLNAQLQRLDSPLRRLYEQTYNEAVARSDVNTVNHYGPAKCLYLVVMYGNPEVRELFKDFEMATDDDGLSYFVDGWGNPIYFLRWAPELALSERNSKNHPDQLDPTEVGGTVISSKTELTGGQWVIDLTGTPQMGWTLLPVIMSSGGVREYNPDGSFSDEKTFGMELATIANGSIVPTVDPFASSGNLDSSPIGAYKDQPNHAIIHNHSARR